MSDQTALSVLGNKNEIMAMQARLASMALPGGKKLQPGEVQALAHLSVTHGLDATNGEIWIIPGSGPMIGIKGLRKKAREQLNHGKAGNFWCNFIELHDPALRDSLKIPAGALAFECRLFDTETISTYVNTIKQLKDAGMPWEIITQIVGAQPYTSGYGYLKAGENTRMTPVQCAMKRAEADAIKRRFDVPFGLAVEGEDAPDLEDIQGEWKVEKPATPSAEQRRADNAALFGSDDFDAELRNVPEIPLSSPSPEEQAAIQKQEAYENACQMTDNGGNAYGRKTTEKLTAILNAPEAPADKKNAARIILEWRAEHKQEA